MATVAVPRTAIGGDDRFFRTIAVIMALVLVAGFSLQAASGRSSFLAPWLIHAHAWAFFGWVAIFVLQTFSGTRGQRVLHRRLGWLSLGWIAAMVVLGTAVVARAVRAGATPFFFQPQHFLIADPMVILVFVILTGAAVALRRRTDWHRRLHLSAMAVLIAPGVGRLIPMPLLIPWAYQVAALICLAFPVAGMIVDLRRRGRVHPAWWWGVGTTLAGMLATEAIVYSPLGDAIYAWVTAGAPGATIAPLAFGDFPPMV